MDCIHGSRGACGHGQVPFFRNYMDYLSALSTRLAAIRDLLSIDVGTFNTCSLRDCLQRTACNAIRVNELWYSCFLYQHLTDRRAPSSSPESASWIYSRETSILKLSATKLDRDLWLVSTSEREKKKKN